MLKFIIVTALNTMLYVASVAELILTETQIVSSIILLITYWCCLFIDA